MIIPLNKVGEQQAEKISKLPGAKPCLVTADTVRANTNIFEEIRKGIYTHVLISPEQALAAEFADISKDPAFKSKVWMVAIDEVHLVKQWGISKFREEYSKLGELRSRLGHNIAWFGCTATFDAETRKKAISSVRFNKAVDIIRTSVDRPDIRLIITPMQRKSVKSFA